jgi:hypothetical protein
LPEPAAARWSGAGELGEAGYQEPLGQPGEEQGDGQAVFGDLREQKAVVITYRGGSKLYVACTGPAYPLGLVTTGAWSRLGGTTTGGVALSFLPADTSGCI